MTALVRWSAFCVVTGRRPSLDLDTARYFTVADDPELDYQGKLAAYRRIADDYLAVDEYREFCESALPHVPELVAAWVTSPDFDDLLVQTVRGTYPPHEHDRFIAHFRGLIDLWKRDTVS